MLVCHHLRMKRKSRLAKFTQSTSNLQKSVIIGASLDLKIFIFCPNKKNSILNSFKSSFSMIYKIHQFGLEYNYGIHSAKKKAIDTLMLPYLIFIYNLFIIHCNTVLNLLRINFHCKRSVAVVRSLCISKKM